MRETDSRESIHSSWESESAQPYTQPREHLFDHLLDQLCILTSTSDNATMPPSKSQTDKDAKITTKYKRLLQHVSTSNDLDGELQVGPSGHGLPFVDIRLKVAP